MQKTKDSSKKNKSAVILISLLSASCFLLLALPQVVNAQSISGGDLCGSSIGTVCGPQHLKELGKRVLTSFALVGGAALVAIVAVRLLVSYFAYVRGDSGAIKRAGEQAFNAFIGFMIIFAVFGGLFLTILMAFGTKPWALQLLQLFSSGLIEHAYAQEGLPNTLSSNNLYDILLAFISLVLRFFVYPAVIVMWVWAGFQFVYSQGNPEGLKKAKAWLLWAFILTIVIFSLQAFLLAFKGTAERIAPGITIISSSNAA